MCFLATSAVAFGQSPHLTPTNPAGRSSHLVEEEATRGNTPSQTDAPDAPQPNEPQNNEPQNTVWNLPKALLHDQIAIWTSPSKARFSDATWLVPLGGLTAALFVTDSDFSRHLSNDPNRLTNYRHVSDYGAYSMAGGAAGT